MAITTELDEVRLEIADNDPTAQLLQDDEIEYLITQEATFWGACARCCEVIARQFLRKADVRIGRGGASLIYSTAAKQYQDMAAAFRKRANAMHAPWTGGTSKSDKASLAQDTDLVQPIFTKTVMDSTFVGGQSSESPVNDDQMDSE